MDVNIKMKYTDIEVLELFQEISINCVMDCHANGNYLHENIYDKVMRDMVENTHVFKGSWGLDYIEAEKIFSRVINCGFIEKFDKNKYRMTDSGLRLLLAVSKRTKRWIDGYEIGKIINSFGIKEIKKIDYFRIEMILNKNINIYIKPNSYNTMQYLVEADIKIHQEIMQVLIDSNEKYFDPSKPKN